MAEQDPRQQINVLSIIQALEDHIIHGAEMSNTQVNAALALLKKTLPDIQAVGAEQKTPKKTLSHEEALALLDQ